MISDMHTGVALVGVVAGDKTVTYSDGSIAPLHQTIAFMGDVDKLSHGAYNTLATIMKAARDWFDARPVEGTVIGAGTLGPHAEPVALTDVPLLYQFRRFLEVEAVASAALADLLRRGHETYVSHISGLAADVGTPVQFASIGMWIGNLRASIPLVVDGGA